MSPIGCEINGRRPRRPQFFSKKKTTSQGGSRQKLNCKVIMTTSLRSFWIVLIAGAIGCCSLAMAFNCLIAVNITMRDGIDLYTCVDFPLGTNETTFDLVMDRSPYGSDKTELIADIYLLEGYVAVRQDQRGTFDSGGHFTMWNNAANDSYDTMAYLAKQSWASGTMFTVGASADGIAVFAQPKDSPPWLKASTMIFSTDAGYPVSVPPPTCSFLPTFSLAP